MIALFQFNIAQMRELYDSPLWDQWKELVPVIHDQVKNADGFLWHYDGTQTEVGFIQPYPNDPLIMGNFSAWTNPTALEKFTFGPGSHGSLMKHRKKWFIPFKKDVHYNVMWWGQLDDRNKDLEFAKKQLARYQAVGNTGTVFGWSDL